MLDTIKVFDICSYVKETYPQYCTHRNLGIIQNGDKVIVTDNESIHNIYNKDEEIKITIYNADKNNEYGTRSISIIPYGTLTTTLSELENQVSSKDIEWELFFDRRNYNPRLKNNYLGLLESIKKIGIETQKIDYDEYVENTRCYETKSGYYLEFHPNDEGYDFTYYDKDKKLIDGGILESEDYLKLKDVLDGIAGLLSRPEIDDSLKDLLNVKGIKEIDEIIENIDI